MFGLTPSTTIHIPQTSTLFLARQRVEFRRGTLSGETWAQRLKRVFNIDIEICSSCGGPVKIIACIEDPVVIEKILTHLDSKAAGGAAFTPVPGATAGKLVRLIGV